VTRFTFLAVIGEAREMDRHLLIIAEAGISQRQDDAELMEELAKHYVIDRYPYDEQVKSIYYSMVDWSFYSSKNHLSKLITKGCYACSSPAYKNTTIELCHKYFLCGTYNQGLLDKPTGGSLLTGAILWRSHKTL